MRIGILTPGSMLERSCYRFYKAANRKALLAGRAFYARLKLAQALKEEPQPQVLLVFGFSNLKPAASRVST